jgi:hypothetical protein
MIPVYVGRCFFHVGSFGEDHIQRSGAAISDELPGETHLRTITLFLMLGCAGFCQDSTSKQEKDSAVLKVMRDFSFVLGTWCPVEQSDKPAKYTEAYSFEPILDGRFIASEELYRSLEGKVLYRDFVVYGVDSDTGKLFLHAYNTDGSIDRTRAVDSPSGKWVFEGTVYGSTRFRDYRYTLTKVDDSHLGVLPIWRVSGLLPVADIRKLATLI